MDKKLVQDLIISGQRKKKKENLSWTRGLD